MFKKILLRSLAGSTAVGSALAISFVAMPAVVTSAPAIANVACSTQYPGSAATTTSLELEHAMAAYGTANTATATVSSVRTPEGRVRFTVVTPGTDFTATVGLQDGEASVSLPRRLPAGETYKVKASFIPACDEYARSSDTTYYVVMKAPTTTDVTAADVTRAENSRVVVTVDSKTLTPDGKVRVALTRSGKRIAAKTLLLSHGHVSTSFGKLRPGSYTAAARYLGTDNFRASRGSDDFRVTRR